ncbi:MAG TPA: Gfo/Idh/MocA family oxidoreductase [Methylomirabilota bacterium]|nr:Gfo/Idh/MocA family oxidoreductase [Methylomirabilota bacterium]
MADGLSATLRIGVVGFGYWGPNLCRNLAEVPGVDVAAVADQHADRRAGAARRHPGARLFEEAAELIAEPDLDAVVIATPVGTHCDLGLAALKAGKDVLVEKPLAATGAEAALLVATAERERRVLMVDHTFVYTGAVRKIAELLEAGELGEIRYYDALRINLGLFQTDVSVVWDLAIHDLSLLQYLLRRRFLTVQATGGSPLGDGLESVAHLTLNLEGGVQAHINVSWISPVKLRQTILVGDRKMVVYDDLEADEKIKVYDRGVVFAAQRQPPLMPEFRVGYRVGDMYSPRVDRREALWGVVAHFVDCVRQRRRPLTGGPEALELLRVLEAAEWSLRNVGQRVTL